MSLTAQQLFANRYKLLQRTALTNNIATWKAEDIKTLTTVTLRCNAEAGNSVVNGLLLKEYMLLTQIRHYNLLMPLHFDEYESIGYIVYPFTDELTLKHSLQAEKTFSEQEAKKLFIAIAEALAALHQENILHRNIQPSNIFSIHGNYVLGAFKRQNEITVAQQQQLIPYSAPELFSEQPEYTEKSDVFSLAVVIYYCCTGNIPWQGLGGMALLKGAMIPNLPNTFSQQLNSVLQKCFAVNAFERPNTTTIITLLNEQPETKTATIIPAPVTETKLNETAPIVVVAKKQKKKPILAYVAVLVIIILFGFISLIYFNKQKETVSKKTLVHTEKTIIEEQKNVQPDIIPEVENDIAEINETNTIDSTISTNKDKPWKRKITPFRNEEGKYGFMGYGRRIIIKPVFEDVFAFSEGVAACKSSGLWGYIDSSGTWAIQPQYKTATVFKSGKAQVEKDGMVFSINLNGKCIEGCESITHQSLQ